MKKHGKIWFIIIAIAAFLVLSGWYLHRHLIPVLQPAGEIASKERNLIIFCLAISATIVVPVFGLLGYFAWKYREDNHTRAQYSPELGGSKLAETVWWLVPTLLIAIISTVTWQSSYALDPYKPLATNKPTLHIQVVALDWKWLFIYPGQDVASVNEAAIPVGVPVDFSITSDTVMTSFWAPQLGGQMYAMPGMETQLNLQAAKVGEYRGVAANISGKGFAGMKFNLKAMPLQQFNSWISSAHASTQTLASNAYANLAAPSENNKTQYYSAVDSSLYNSILMKYMMPMGSTDTSMNGMVM